MLDNQVQSRPIINFKENPDGIDGRTGAQISGNFTPQQVNDLAEVLRIGAPPIKLALISQSTVSATLGEQALDQGLKAGIAGLIIVLIFLVAYYRFLGVIAGLGLLAAVEMLSGRNARYLGLHDRGVIAPGKRADLNLIDPARLSVGDAEAGARPAQPAAGASCRRARVTSAPGSAGQAVQRDGQISAARPGRPVRMGVTNAAPIASRGQRQPGPQPETRAPPGVRRQPGTALHFASSTPRVNGASWRVTTPRWSMTAVAPVLVARNIGRSNSSVRIREICRCWSTAMVSPNQPMLLTLANIVGALAASAKRKANSAPNRSS